MILRLAILVLIPLLLSNGITASEKEPAATLTPIMNPWDSNQWEPGSDRSFWRKGAEIRKDAAKPKTPEKAVLSPSAAPAKPDFSDRQTEK